MRLDTSFDALVLLHKGAHGLLLLWRARLV